MTTKQTIPGEEAAHEDIQALLKKSIALSEEILEQNKKIRRRLFLMSLGGYIKWVLILTPIVLGIIYIPPFLEKLPTLLTGTVSNIVGGAVDDAVKNTTGSTNLSIDQILRLISN